MKKSILIVVLLIAINLFSQANMAVNGGFENWSLQTNVTINNNFLGTYGLNYNIDSQSFPANTTSTECSNCFYDVICGNRLVTANYELNFPPYLLNENFGSGLNIDLPINTIATAYCYNNQINSACLIPSEPSNPSNRRLEDNQYVVTKGLNPINAAWFDFRDNTSGGIDLNGRFLAINIGAAAGPNGILYSKQINNVIAGNSIVVEINFANLLKANYIGATDPEFIVQIVDINNGLIAQQLTGAIARNNLWQLKSFNFNPANNTSLKLVIRSGSINYFGNDAVIDDIKVYQPATSCTTTKEFPVNISCNQVIINQTNYPNITCDGLTDGEFSVVTNIQSRPINWTVQNDVLESNIAEEGTSSVKLKYIVGVYPPKIKTNILLNANQQYKFRYKYKYLNSEFTAQQPILIELKKFNNNTVISLYEEIAFNNNWTNDIVSFTPTETGLYEFSIYLLSTNNQSFEVLIDDFQVFEQYTSILDPNFETKLQNLGIDSGTIDGKVLTENIIDLQTLNISNLLVNLSKSTESLLENNVSNLKGIENFDALKILNCKNNNITNLDLSKNKYLIKLDCSNNQLVSLNLKNNYNELITNANIDLRNNILSCIQVDNVNYSLVNWFDKKDSFASFSESCSILNTNNSLFDKAIIYPNPTKNLLCIDNIELDNIAIYNNLGALIKEFKATNELKNQIDLSDFSKGFYFIKLQKNQNSVLKKIVVN